MTQPYITAPLDYVQATHDLHFSLNENGNDFHACRQLIISSSQCRNIINIKYWRLNSLNWWSFHFTVLNGYSTRDLEQAWSLKTSCLKTPKHIAAINGQSVWPLCFIWLFYVTSTMWKLIMAKEVIAQITFQFLFDFLFTWFFLYNV